MATTEQLHTATGTASTEYSFPFPYFKEGDIEVTVDNVIQTQTTKYTFPTATAIKFTAGNIPANGKSIKIYRNTDVDSLKAIFSAGSSIRASDLNNNLDLVLYGAQDKVITSKISNDAVTSDKLDTNIDITGTFDVTGATTLDSTLNVAGATVMDTTLNTKGNVDFDANLNVDGTLTVDGISTLTGAVSAPGGVTGDLTGTASLATSVTATSNNSNNETVYPTFVDGVSGTQGIETDSGLTYNPSTGVLTTTSVTGNLTGNVTGNVTGDITGDVTGDVTGNADTATDLAASAKITNSEQSGHTANDTTYYTTSASDARYYNIGSTEEIISSESWVSDDTSIATTKAVDNRVINLVDEVGGFVPIADESDFPATNPDINSAAGTIVSIGTLTTSYTPSTGTVTIPASTLDNLSNDLTITGCGSTVLAAGFGVLVETKALSDTAYAANPSYTFHRLTPKSSEVTTVAGISGNITTVAGISSDVTAVAGKETEVGRLGTADAVADLALLGTADVVSDMNTLATADIVSDMNTLATSDVISDMDTVAGISSNVTTVAGISSNVSTVAGISANVTTVASNNSNVTAVAGKITEVETVADNLTAVENFNDTYQIDDFSPSAPTTDGGGNALAEGDLAYDTTNDKLKVWTGSAWETGVEGHTNLMARAGGTFTGDVTLNDDVVLNLGSDNDIRVYHTGTHGYINVVTGNLNIRTNGTEEAIVAKKDGAVELYHDGSQKISTTASGIDVTGTTTDDGANHAGDVIFQGDGANSYWDKSNDSLIFNDNAGVNLGTGRDVRFYFDGNHTYLNVVDGDLNIRTNGTESAIVCTKNAGVAAYYDANKKFETTTGGVDITGNITVSGTVDGIDIATDVAANTAKVTNATHTGDVTGSGALTIADDAVTYAKMQNVSSTDRVLGRDSSGAGVVEEIAPAALRTMINVEDGATADQSNAEIRAAVEAATDSNVFTDADHTKLNGIEASATADQTGAEIKSAYEGESDTNAFTDALLSKLNAIEASATADQTNAEIRAAVEAATDSNVFTDADHSKLNAIEASADVTDATNVNAAGAIMHSDLGTKGQIVVGDGSGDATILSVGSNTHVLTADSSEASGVKWAAQAGAPEGEAVLSTTNSNEASTKFLRADGDGTCSWQVPPDTTTPADDSVTGAKLSVSLVQGDVLYGSGTDTLARLAKGTAGQVLKMNSGATAPEWGAASSGTITALNNQAANRLTTIGSTTTELDGEANLTFDGTDLTVAAGGAIVSGIFENPATLGANHTIGTNNNAMAVGPFSVGSATLTIPSGSVFTVV